MKNLIAFVFAFALSVPAFAGTLTAVVGTPGLWEVDGDPNTLLLLEETAIASDVAGNDTIWQVTGVYGNVVTQVVVPVYGSCVAPPAGWNVATGELYQCTLHGAGQDATIFIVDVDLNATWDYE